MPRSIRHPSFLARPALAAAVISLLVGATVPTLVAASPTNHATRSAPGYLVPLYAGNSSETYRPIPAPGGALAGDAVSNSLVQTSTITVTYHGFTAKAKAAFQAAVNVWQSILVSDQVVHVDASWTDLGGGGILGSAGPDAVWRENTLWYPSALHEARCDCDDDAGPEIIARFNSSFSDWYKGTDGNVPNNKWDLETVVLHELGHGLGFLSSFQLQSDNQVHWGFGNPIRPMGFDANEWDASSGGHQIVTEYANGSPALKLQVTDGSVYLGGTHIEAVLGGRAKLYAPSPWQQGSSNSHLDEDKFAPGTVNALMTPVLNDGESIHDPGPATEAIFEDIGWSLSNGSDDTTPPTVGQPKVNIVAPQTMGSSVNVRVSWPDATDDSGIASYELQRQEGAGAWTSVSLSTPTSTSGQVAVTRGSNYSFRVRATDGAGNTGAFTTTSSANMSTIQENAGGIAYSGAWTRTSVGGSAGGFVDQSSATNATATFMFTGTSVAFVTTAAPGRGIAQITLDGTDLGTIDLYASSKKAKRVAWAPNAALSAGSHTLVIRVTGTKNASSASTRIDVDAFLTWP